MEQLKRFIANSNNTIIYTGAGMSTESGLPDFRSADRGLWKRFNPSELANVDALHKNQEEFTEFYRYRLSEITKYKPHQGHFILSDWEKRGIIKGIITQNVDGFHHDAGNNNVMELHGTFREFYCHNCHKDHDREAYLAGAIYCLACDNIIRPGIVLFGESLPKDTFIKAEEASKEADLFIVLGSSLTVTPANIFPIIAKEHGAKLVIINHEPTELDSAADYIINDRNIKEVLIELDEGI